MSSNSAQQPRSSHRQPSTGTASTTALHRPGPERSPTWPLLDRRLVTACSTVSQGCAQRPLTASPHSQAPAYTSRFAEEVDEHPEQHFLSPIQMYEFEDWADDSDDDGDEVEWDAGITDFALFDSDRRAAQDAQQPVPGKWRSMLQNQASALERAVKRSRFNPPSHERDSLSWSPTVETVPELTPDTSPNLRDDLDECPPRQSSSHEHVPNYLTVIITPPDGDSSTDSAIAEDDEEGDDLPISFYIQRGQQQRRESMKRFGRPQRPGLRYSRTMSGKPHVWRQPSWEIYPVREDVAGEANGEMSAD